MRLLSEVAQAVLAPGWNARHRRRPLAVVLLSFGLVVPLGVAVYAAFSGRNWVALSLDSGFLAWVMVAFASALAARLVAVAELWHHAGRPTPVRRSDLLAIGVVVAVCAPLTVGLVQVGRARADIQPAFSGASDEPLYDAETPAVASTNPSEVRSDVSPTSRPDDLAAPDRVDRVDRLERPADVAVVDAADEPAITTPTTEPPRPSRPSSGVDAALLENVHTVLLLGGDGGPGRFGLRTDTMMLFSLHEPSGRAALISIPRDLEGLLFPPGSALEARYPYGFDDIANAVYPVVSSRRSLRDAYDVPGVRPGVVGIVHGIGYSLDVTIEDYALVDMQGFLELIDALGGVTVDVPKQVPMPGNVPGAPTQYPDTIGPGVIEMDGTTALGYVRSRKGDNDFRRTERQRELLAALATQVSVDDVVFAFGEVASAVGATLRTSMTPDELAEVLNVIGGETAIVESVGLVPPLVSVTRPDFDRMARIVGEVQLALVTGRPSGY